MHQDWFIWKTYYIHQTHTGAELASIHRIPIWPDRDKDKLMCPRSVSEKQILKVSFERLREIVVPSTANNRSIAHPSHLKLW